MPELVVCNMETVLPDILELRDVGIIETLPASAEAPQLVSRLVFGLELVLFAELTGWPRSSENIWPWPVTLSFSETGSTKAATKQEVQSLQTFLY